MCVSAGCVHLCACGCVFACTCMFMCVCVCVHFGGFTVGPCVVIVGPASSGQSPSHWSEERGEGVTSVHSQQCGGEDTGCCSVQAER